MERRQELEQRAKVRLAGAESVDVAAAMQMSSRPQSRGNHCQASEITRVQPRGAQPGVDSGVTGGGIAMVEFDG